MPRRHSSRVNPIKLAGAPVLSLDAKHRRELLADAVEEVVIDWTAVAGALELSPDQSKMLEIKTFGVTLAAMPGHLGWDPSRVEAVRKSLKRAISGAPLRGKRANFQHIRLRGSSANPFHVEDIAGREVYALDRLHSENFLDVMRAEWPERVEEKTVRTFLPKNGFLAGTSRSTRMLHKSFQIDIKAAGEDGTFAGDLAVYGNVDYGNECIVPGACTQTLQKIGGKVALYLNHASYDVRQKIGVLSLQDSPKTLRATGKLNLDLAAAKDAQSIMRFDIANGLKTGLSIGYSTVKDTVKDGIRYLQQIDLWEGSIVGMAMNPEAAVNGVKHGAALTEEERLQVENVARTLFGKAPYSLSDYREAQQMKSQVRAVVREAFGLAGRV